MLNTRDVCRNNNSIANDYYKGAINNTQYTRESKGFFMKRKSGATKTLENNEARYTSRRNVCDKCFMTKSVANGTCSCDE